MPTYQYRCTECGRDLEVVQKFSDPSLTECPTCAGALRKVFNAVGVVFKGSGFYRTDSRASAGAKSADGSGDQTKAEPARDKGDGSAKPDSGTKPATEAKPKGDKAPAGASSSSGSSDSGSSSSTAAKAAR